jgi:hypothetical protein
LIPLFHLGGRRVGRLKEVSGLMSPVLSPVECGVFEVLVKAMIGLEGARAPGMGAEAEEGAVLAAKGDESAVGAGHLDLRLAGGVVGAVG